MLLSRFIALSTGYVARRARISVTRAVAFSLTSNPPTPFTFNTNLTTSRTYSKSTAMSDIVTYEDVITYKDRTDVLLIDVREPNELQETGSIPSSINVPLGEVTSTLSNSKPDDFKKKYGRDLPAKDMTVVFSCKMGGRATKAMEAAKGIGYKNAKVYKGSWNDWISHQS